MADDPKKLRYIIREDANLIAQAGYPYIIISFLLFGFAAFISIFLAVPFLILFFVVLNFFRNPERVAPEDADAIVSPADGKVIAIEDVNDTRYLNRRLRRVSVFMSPFNVHVNRMPCDGQVERVIYTPGKKLAAFAEKASLENEQNAVILKAANDQEIVFVQIAGFLARRILCDARRGDLYQKGERYGLIRFGSRMDVYLPLHCPVEVKLGDRVQAGTSVLARF